MRYLAADVGRTFTDLVLVDVDPASGAGRVQLDKVTSQATGSADGIADGITRIAAAAGLQPEDIDLFVHGFTVGTNAFLTRNGAKVALAVTKGFRDILVIGSQSRPDRYSLTPGRSRARRLRPADLRPHASQGPRRRPARRQGRHLAQPGSPRRRAAQQQGHRPGAQDKVTSCASSAREKAGGATRRIAIRHSRGATGERDLYESLSNRLRVPADVS